MLSWNRGTYVYRYLTEYYFLHVHMFYHVWLTCHFIVCLGSYLAKMAVNSHATHKITGLRTADKKSDSRAVHEVLLICSA